jgi:hypothetical protein
MSGTVTLTAERDYFDEQAIEIVSRVAAAGLGDLAQLLRLGGRYRFDTPASSVPHGHL